MSAGLPRRPPLAMKLWVAWLFRRNSRARAASAAPGHAAGKPMSIESFEHMVRGRLRIFLRHTWLVAILGSIILGGGLWAAIYFTTAPTAMRIAAGPADSADVKLVRILAQKFADDRDRVRLQLVATDGPKQSAQAMTDGAADLAILPSTLVTSPDWPVVAILRQNVMALIVPAPAATAADKPDRKAKGGKNESARNGKSAKGDKTEKTEKSAKAEDADKLEKVMQLAGRRVGIVTGGVATRALLDVVLDHYGVAPAKVEVSLIDPQNLAAAVKANQLDAIFVAGAATGPAMTEAIAAAARNGEAPSFIAIDQAAGIARRNPAFHAVDIDAGTFGGNPPSPDDTLTTLGFAEYLVARKSFSREAVSTLAKLIYSSRLALAAALPGEIKIEAPSTDKDAGAVVHAGALAYLTDDQKSFFDKYGDDIFYAVLIFPVFGSAIAGVASYFRSTRRTRRLRLLQRLLDLVRKAHSAPSLETLEQMQFDVDQLVIAIIHQSEHEEYDQTVQMSFSLALDQVRFAIATRRDALLEGAGTAESKSGAKAAAA